MSSDYLHLKGLTKRFGDNPPVVAGIDLAIAKGELVTLLGPSGCGKTTILRMIAGLIAPTAGTIRIGGADITATPPHQRNMGLVFQSYALFPHLTAADNIAFGLVERGLPRAERERRVADALALVRLTGFETRKPRELSGGQQQRVALARALVIRPDVLLLDESLSNLDAKLREEMRVEIRDIQKQLAITTVFVTHDQVEALTLSDRLAVMEGGRIAQLGSPQEVYEKPATKFVGRFIGRANFLKAEAKGGRLAVAGMPTTIATKADGLKEVLVRPHRIRFVERPEEGDIAISGKVNRLVFIGDIVQASVSTLVGDIAVEVPTRVSGWKGPGVGEAATIAFQATDAHVFEAG